MKRQHHLSPTFGRKNRKEIFGFDIETYGKKNTFYCGSVFGDSIRKTFFDKRELIEFFKTSPFNNSIVSATNLQFDFNGTFFKEKEIKEFYPCYRSSDLIFTRSFINKKEFSMKRITKNDKTITFIDTLNYAKLSVSDIGKILGIPKLPTPEFLGEIPKTEKEKCILTRYNMRDAQISQKFIKFLWKSFEKLGATPKNTIASTSMSLFKNKYLDRTYFLHDRDDLLREFNAYYGGRVEAFYRGQIENCNYYDINSLYPAVMRNEYPDPNSMKKSRENTVKYIENFDGIAKVDIFIPSMEKQILPFRYDNKLYFPQGMISGWYCNVELRKALEKGCVIKKVYESYYSTENVIPFYDFVVDLYKQRKELKEKGSQMQLVIKLIMNSLYGKFGQKFIDRDQIIPIPSFEELQKYDDYEFIGEFLRIKQKYSHPRPFCIPFFALYTTAYGRLKLLEYLERCDPFYCDTDSIITKKYFETSNALGKLKLEMKIKKGVIVKPKMYGFIDENDCEHVKIKGVGTRLNYIQFMEFLKMPKITYDKFMKFKESIRRGFSPNEIQPITKVLDLEDNKRLWDSPFDENFLQKSTPMLIENDLTCKKS